MSLRESEPRAARRRRSDPTHDRDINQYRILSFADWCRLNGISQATGRRILKSGKGPVVTQLSDRRIGISVRANAEWQEARALIDH
jgi:hypothetical protein